MIAHELAAPADTDWSRAVGVIETACADAGLHITLKGTQAAYPGCVHWHYKQGRAPGTLEITLWPAARRLWFKVAAGRQGAWIAEVMTELEAAIDAGLRSTVGG